jgi:Secretion system C-terminal sorting domain
MGTTPTFQWYRNGNIIPWATASTYNYTSAATGTQWFTVVVTRTPNGCYTSGSPVSSTSPVTNVVVNPTPNAPIDNIVQPTCTVSTWTITVTNWQAWDQFSFNNGTTFQTSNIATGLAAGTYQVLRKNTAWCISVATAEVINSAPVTPSAPTIVQVSNVLSVQSPIAWASYQWQKKNTTNGLWEDLVGAITTSYTFTVAGEYRTNITNNGCGPVASNTINAVITSIWNLNNSTSNIRIYPSPLQNWQKLTIDSLPQLTTDVKIGIYDAMWRRVFLMDARVSNKKVDVNLPFLTSGMYFIRLQDKTSGKRYNGEKIVVK